MRETTKGCDVLQAGFLWLRIGVPTIPFGARFGALPEGGFGYGALLHQHHCLSDDA